MPFTVAIVSRDAAVRNAAARAFDAAPPDWSVRLVDEAPAEADADALVFGCDVAVGRGAVGRGAVGRGIVFDPERPDQVLGALGTIAARRGRRRVVTVVGTAGGAGVTSLALHLAAEWGPGTCCAELGVPGVAARLGLPSDARTWLPRDDDLVASALPVGGGFRVLLASSPASGATSFPLGEVSRAFDRVVLDAGTERDLSTLLDDVAVLVTPPTRPGALVARDVLDSFPDARWAVVVNRTGSGGQIMRAALEGLVGRPVAIELPCCPALRDAEDEARLLSGRWHRWRRGVSRLARALDGC